MTCPATNGSSSQAVARSASTLAPLLGPVAHLVGNGPARRLALSSSRCSARHWRVPLERGCFWDRSNAASQRLYYLALELELEFLFLAGDRRED